MPEFIEPVVDKVLAVLAARTPALLAAENVPAFRAFGKQFRGVSVNFPEVWVSPVRSEFDAEMQATSHQAHQVRIKFGVGGSEPDVVTEQAMAYMRAVHQALAASWPGDWAIDGAQVTRVFVRGHDYGPLFVQQGTMARFPEMDVVVETHEAWAAGIEGV